MEVDLLERVGFGLPAAIELHAHLDTPVYHLLASFEVDAKLHDISIVKGIRLRLGTRGTQSDMVKERP